MPLVVRDRVKETSITAGTGSLALDGAVAGFQSFAAIGNGNTTYYAIVDNIANTWEVGVGTYTATGTTLSRDTVLANSLGTTGKINFAANSKDVFVTYPAGRSVYSDGTNIVPATSATVLTTSGGTGLSSYTAGDLPFYATGTALSKLSIGAANTVLTSSGSAPQWGTSINLTTVTAQTVVASNGIFVNGATVSTSYSIPSGSNAMSAGTITVADGVTVTVPDGSFWTVV
jgi:hypothetical protein